MDVSELQQLLSKIVEFQSIDGNNSAKHDCLTWVDQTFFSDWIHERHSGDIEGCPYLYYCHPHAKWLWFAHLDVVPGEPEQFTVRYEGDKAWGRGVKDMKGAALPFLIALQEKLAAGEDPQVSVLLTTDEETAGPTIPALLEKGVLDAAVAFTPDTGASPWIVHEHKGVVWADLTAKGSGCHAALPWQGDNPVWKLAAALQKLYEAVPVCTEDDWGMTVSPAKLEGSPARNKTPYECSCSIDIRYTAEDASSPEDVITMLQKCLPEDCELKVAKAASPLHSDPAHPFVSTLQKIASQVTGSSVEIGREHGCTDARYFSDRNIPAYLYGPLGDGIHGRDEWVSISSLCDQYEISRGLLEADF